MGGFVVWEILFVGVSSGWVLGVFLFFRKLCVLRSFVEEEDVKLVFVN